MLHAALVNSTSSRGLTTTIRVIFIVIHDINKPLIAPSSIYNATTKKLNVYQIVKFVTGMDGSTPKTKISVKLRLTFALISITTLLILHWQKQPRRKTKPIPMLIATLQLINVLRMKSTTLAPVLLQQTPCFTYASVSLSPNGLIDFLESMVKVYYPVSIFTFMSHLLKHVSQLHFINIYHMHCNRSTEQNSGKEISVIENQAIKYRGVTA